MGAMQGGGGGGGGGHPFGGRGGGGGGGGGGFLGAMGGTTQEEYWTNGRELVPWRHWTYAHRLPDTDAPRDIDECAGLRAECDGWLQQLRKASVTEAEAKDNILAAAQRCGLVSGKWLIDVLPAEAERAWALVAAATRDGRLGCTAKIATAPRNDFRGLSKRLILVYADDFGDRDACAQLLSWCGEHLGCGPGCGVRREGLKPDVFTFLGGETGSWRVHQDLLPATTEAAALGAVAGGASALPKGRGKKQCKFGQGCRNGADCWFDHASGRATARALRAAARVAAGRD